MANDFNKNSSQNFENSKQSVIKGAKISLGTQLSVACGQGITNLIEGAFGARIFDFYENRILLKPELIGIAMVIYAIWNMFNDPFIGYITDRPRKFWKKWGKRFPWIIGGGISLCMAFILLFLIPHVLKLLFPTNNSVIFVLSLLFTLFLYDTLYSLFDTNYCSLIPDKFRNDEDRHRQSGLSVTMGLIGIVIGFIVPPLIIIYEVNATYVTASIVIAIIGLVFIGLFIKGGRETKEMRERAIRVDINKNQDPFFKTMLKSLKQKNFIAYLIIFTCFQAVMLLMIGSVTYVNKYLIVRTEGVKESDESLLFIGFIIMGLLSLPLWIKLSEKLGHKKLFLIEGTILCLAIIPLFFINTLISAIIVVSFIGFGITGFWFMLQPMLADIMDEAAVLNNKRNDSFYMGIRTFFSRIAIIIQVLTFTIVHIVTGFEQGEFTQGPLAVLGIRIQVALVPIVVMIIGLVFFAILFDLTPEKKEIIRKKMLEMDL